MQFNYIRYTMQDEYYPIIAFDEYEYVDHDNVINEENVVVDPNNCIKVWTYDNSDGDNIPNQVNPSYIFANADDYEAWNDLNNSDGHANCCYRYVVVNNGIETEYDG